MAALVNSSRLKQCLSRLKDCNLTNYSGIGDGIGEMMLTDLKQTGCFTVMDRDAIQEIKQEYADMGQEFKITSVADFLISGAVTSINMEKKNANLGLGFIPVLSAVDIKKTKATVGMDLRIVDVKSADILFSQTYEANNSKTGLGIGAGGGFNNIGFGGMFSSLKGTALEEVVRDVVIRATSDIIASVQTARGGLAAGNATPQTSVPGNPAAPAISNTVQIK